MSSARQLCANSGHDPSLTSLREKLLKIGAKIVRHGRYVIFQLAKVAVTLTPSLGFRVPPAG